MAGKREGRGRKRGWEGKGEEGGGDEEWMTTKRRGWGRQKQERRRRGKKRGWLARFLNPALQHSVVGLTVHVRLGSEAPSTGLKCREIGGKERERWGKGWENEGDSLGGILGTTRARRWQNACNTALNMTTFKNGHNSTIYNQKHKHRLGNWAD